MLLGLAIVTTGCQSNAFTREGLPVPVTKQGEVILSMWQGSWIAAWSVGIIVWGGILWAIIFHRKRGDHDPTQATRTETHDEERLLMSWSVATDPKKDNWRADLIVVADR